MLQLPFLLSCMGLLSLVASVPLRLLISEALGFQSAPPLQVSVFADSNGNDRAISQRTIDINPATEGCVSIPEAPLQSISDRQSEKAPYPKALYFNVNRVPNAVASVGVNPDGTLKEGLTTATEGNGASAIQAKVNKPAAPDALLGTGPIIVVKDVCVLVFLVLG